MRGEFGRVIPGISPYHMQGTLWVYGNCREKLRAPTPVIIYSHPTFPGLAFIGGTNQKDVTSILWIIRWKGSIRNIYFFFGTDGHLREPCTPQAEGSCAWLKAYLQKLICQAGLAKSAPLVFRGSNPYLSRPLISC